MCHHLYYSKNILAQIKVIMLGLLQILGVLDFYIKYNNKQKATA